MTRTLLSLARRPRTALSRAAVAAVLVTLLGISADAQVGRSGLLGTVVDENGAPMPDVEISMQPAGETSGGSQVAKTDKRGRFGNRFLASGRYVLSAKDRDRYFIKSAEVQVKDAGGIQLSKYDIVSHPKDGLTSIPVQGGQVTEVRLVVTSAAVRDRMLRQIEGGAMQGDVNELVQLFNTGEHERALALGQQLMQRSTTEIPEVIHLVGLTHARLKQYEPAERLIRRAIELAPDQHDFVGSLGTLLLEIARAKGRQQQDASAAYNEAQTWLAKAVEASNPPAPALLVNYSIALEGAGRKDEALRVMERIAKEEPNNVVVRLRMAALLRAQGKPERALEILNSLPGGADPRAVDSLYNVALTFYNAEDYESAMAALKRAEELNPRHAEVQRLIGRVLYIAGDNRNALTHLRRFLELAPDHPEAKDEREMVKYLEKTTGGK
jgi:tetratricopeptide (TPR) repeat protein